MKFRAQVVDPASGKYVTREFDSNDFPPEQQQLLADAMNATLNRYSMGAKLKEPHEKQQDVQDQPDVRDSR